MTTNGTRGLATGADRTQHATGEIVVASDHASLVLGLLGVDGRKITDTIPDLGLSLLGLDPDALDAALVGVETAIRDLPSPGRAYEPLESPDVMERLMAALRFLSAERFDGWVPTMGKNRVVLGGEAMPYFSPKDDPFVDDGPENDPGPLQVPFGVDARDGSGVVVGVLDTRVIRHPAFAGVVQFVGDSETTSQEVGEAWQGHGTFVTGLVHAHAPAARILARAVLTGDGGTATAWDAAKGLVDLVQQGAQLINLSLGCVTGDNEPPFAVRAAVERMRDRVLLVAAAGNYDSPGQADTSTAAPSKTPPSWPAALDGVLAVGSTAQDGTPSGFSPKKPWVDLVAVGERVPSTFATGDEILCLRRDGEKEPRKFEGSATWSGTSFAAAIAAGRIAALSGRQVRTWGELLRDPSSFEDDVAKRP